MSITEYWGFFHVKILTPKLCGIPVPFHVTIQNGTAVSATEGFQEDHQYPLLWRVNSNTISLGRELNCSTILLVAKGMIHFYVCTERGRVASLSLRVAWVHF